VGQTAIKLVPVVNVLGMVTSVVSVDEDPVGRRGAPAVDVGAADDETVVVVVLADVVGDDVRETMQDAELPQETPFWQQPPPREAGHDCQPETQVVTVTMGSVVVVVLVAIEMPWIC